MLLSSSSWCTKNIVFYFRATAGTITAALSNYFNHPHPRQLRRNYFQSAQTAWPDRTTTPQPVGTKDVEKVSPLYCEPLQMQAHRDPGCDCAQPVRLWARDVMWQWGRCCCLNMSQKPGLALIKEEKRLLYQFPLLVFFNCDSLKINMVKHFKITFNYPSSISIAQFSQGTVILPILLFQSLLSTRPESFSFSLPSIASPPSLIFPVEGKFLEEWGYAGLLEATCPGVQGNTATLQVQHWWMLNSIHGSSDQKVPITNRANRFVPQANVTGKALIQLPSPASICKQCCGCSRRKTLIYSAGFNHSFCILHLKY